MYFPSIIFNRIFKESFIPVAARGLSPPLYGHTIRKHVADRCAVSPVGGKIVNS